MNWKLEAYSKQRRSEIEILKDNIIVGTNAKLVELIDEALSDTKPQKHLHLGVIPAMVINRINNETEGIPRSLSGKLFKEGKEYSLEIGQDCIRHLSDNKKSFTRDDAIDYISALPTVVTEFDFVQFTYYGKGISKSRALRFIKTMPDGKHIALEVVSQKARALRTQTVFMDKEDYTIKKKGANILPMQNNTLPIH
jgi:hypothetical protein